MAGDTLMPTKQECKQGIHSVDNQGLCWWCGTVVDVYLYEEYFGPTKPTIQPVPKKRRPNKRGSKKS